jgi:hypothetical protein
MNSDDAGEVGRGKSNAPTGSQYSVALSKHAARTSDRNMLDHML